MSWVRIRPGATESLYLSIVSGWCNFIWFLVPHAENEENGMINGFDWLAALLDALSGVSSSVAAAVARGVIRLYDTEKLNNNFEDLVDTLKENPNAKPENVASIVEGLSDNSELLGQIHLAIVSLLQATVFRHTVVHWRTPATRHRGRDACHCFRLGAE